MRLFLLLTLLAAGTVSADEPKLVVKPDAFKTLVNPACSHCVDEAKRRAADLRSSDPVLCWTRGYSEGGVIPLRFFLNPYRVISDSYGVFVYDPDAGYARGFAPSYNFTFHGWRNGVMVMKHKDGTLYSCLSGVAFADPKKGDRLTPIPTLTSTWGTWTTAYPNAVAYHMFERYTAVTLPEKDNTDSVASRGKPDGRLPAEQLVLGVRVAKHVRAYATNSWKGVKTDTLGEQSIVLLRDDRTSTVAAYYPVAAQPRKYRGPNPNKDGVSPPDSGTLMPPGSKELPKRKLTLQATGAGIEDAETKTRWDVAGRGVKGELTGWTLEPVDGVVCKFFAWAAEYPETEIDKPKKKAEVNTTVKEIAGTSEFLRLLPNTFATLKAVDAKRHTVTLLLDGEKVAKVWEVERDAEIKVSGWWGRLEQLTPGQRVWVWLKLNRKKDPVSVVMLADEPSEEDMHGSLSKKRKLKFTPAQIEAKRADQMKWLEKKWTTDGLPSTVSFIHGFSGELELMLDHEGMRYARSLNQGDVVHVAASPDIKAVVKSMTPGRERTAVRLIVGELEASELKVGQRIGLKMRSPSQEILTSPYPPDIGQRTAKNERIDWFLASIYCTCMVRQDICTGHFYTLASCNPNGCGLPRSTRREIGEMIDQGKTDKQIWDVLLKERGPLMGKPHLLP